MMIFGAVLAFIGLITLCIQGIFWSPYLDSRHDMITLTDEEINELERLENLNSKIAMGAVIISAVGFFIMIVLA
jgi:hypothetical protein